MLTIHFMHGKDLPRVIDIEVKSHRKWDEDFEVWTLPDYSWSIDEIKKIMQEPHVKGVVAKEPMGTILGSMIYEITENSYHILMIGADPLYKPEKTREALFCHVYEKMAQGNRTEITMDVPDGDYVTLKFLISQGFKYKNITRGYNGYIDAWACTFTKQQHLVGNEPTEPFDFVD